MFLLCSWCPSLVFPSPSLHESFCSDWLIAGSIFTSPCFYSTTPLFFKKSCSCHDRCCLCFAPSLPPDSSHFPPCCRFSLHNSPDFVHQMSSDWPTCPGHLTPTYTCHIWCIQPKITNHLFTSGGLSAVAMKVKTQWQVRTTLVVPGNESKSFPVSAVNFSRIQSSFLKFAFTRVVFYKMSNVWVTHKKDFYLCSHWV